VHFDQRREETENERHKRERGNGGKWGERKKKEGGKKHMEDWN
jgi:hypothetical protein